VKEKKITQFQAQKGQKMKKKILSKLLKNGIFEAKMTKK